MGKQRSVTPSQVQNNENNNNKKKKFRGRPPKPPVYPETLEPQQNQQICWFSDDKSRKIVEILGTKCQILYKCLSGKSANNFKNKIWSSADNKMSFNEFKSFRQDFAKQMTTLQNELLIKLQAQFKIKLVDGNEQMEYFFFQNNTTQNESPINSDELINLLLPYIHKDFELTLQELIKFYNQPQNLDQTVQNNNLYDIETHKHLGCWAFIRAWGKEAKEHIKKLQRIDDDEIPEKQQIDQPISLTELKKTSENIFKKKEEEIKVDIKQLIQKYQIQYKEEIDDLIDQFRQGSTQQNN